MLEHLQFCQSLLVLGFLMFLKLRCACPGAPV